MAGYITKICYITCYIVYVTIQLGPSRRALYDRAFLKELSSYLDFKIS